MVFVVLFFEQISHRNKDFRVHSIFTFFDMNEIFVKVAMRVANLENYVLTSNFFLVTFNLFISGRILFVPLAWLILLKLSFRLSLKKVPKLGWRETSTNYWSFSRCRLHKQVHYYVARSDSLANQLFSDNISKSSSPGPLPGLGSILPARTPKSVPRGQWGTLGGFWRSQPPLRETGQRRGLVICRKVRFKLNCTDKLRHLAHL